MKPIKVNADKKRRWPFFYVLYICGRIKWRGYKLESLSEVYNSDKVLQISSYAHMYAACIDNLVVGCGAISSFWGKEDESILLTIFVLPELHCKGIGRKIIKTLENDDYFFRAKRIEIPASITACDFYKKMGYAYKGGIEKLDGEGNYRLEKFR